MPKLKTVKNWEKEDDIKLKWDVKPSGNAENIRCLTCKNNDGRLQGLKNYNRAWIDGSKNATSDSVRNHVNTDAKTSWLSEICRKCYEKHSN